MKILLIFIVFVFTNLNTLLFATEKKCGKFDVVCKSKKFVNDTKEFQKKGLLDNKKQISKTKDKVFSIKDVIVDDMKDTAEGVSEGVKDGVKNVKKKMKK